MSCLYFYLYYNILRIEMQELIQFIFRSVSQDWLPAARDYQAAVPVVDRQGFGCFLGVSEFQEVDFLAARAWQVEAGL